MLRLIRAECATPWSRARSRFTIPGSVPRARVRDWENVAGGVQRILSAPLTNPTFSYPRVGVQLAPNPDDCQMCLGTPGAGVLNFFLKPLAGRNWGLKSRLEMSSNGPFAAPHVAKF